MQIQIHKIVLVGMLSSLMSGTASTQSSPHFSRTVTVNGVFSNGGIRVSFKEVHLGKNVTVTYLLDGSFIAHYGCINPGGNVPESSKVEVERHLLTEAALISSNNGTIEATLEFTPPDPDGVVNCPGSQVAVLADIAYFDLTLEDVTSETLHVDGDLDRRGLSATFFTFK